MIRYTYCGQPVELLETLPDDYVVVAFPDGASFVLHVDVLTEHDPALDGAA